MNDRVDDHARGVGAEPPRLTPDAPVARKVTDELTHTDVVRRDLDNALWCAAHGGRRETAELLPDRGADPARVGHDDLTAAQAAERSHATGLAARLAGRAER